MPLLSVNWPNHSAGRFQPRLIQRAQCIDFSLQWSTPQARQVRLAAVGGLGAGHVKTSAPTTGRGTVVAHQNDDTTGDQLPRREKG